MPFNIFPALQTRVPSEPANALALQQLSTSRQGNALAQEKAGFVRQDRDRATAGRGAAANFLSASPADRPAALAKAAKVLDVDQLNKFTEQFMDSPKANQDKIEADLKKSAGIAAAWQSKTPEEKAALLPQVVAYLNEMGLEDVPTTLPEFDLYAQVMALNNSNVQAAAVKAQFEKPDTVSKDREAQLKRIAQGSRAPSPGIKPLDIERKLLMAGIDPKSEEGRKYILADLAGQQVSFEQGADGKVSVRVGKGVGDGPDLQSKTVGDIEGKLVNAREGLARIDGIVAKFKPEYQVAFTRAGHAWTGLKARLGRDVSAEDTATYTEFADYQRDAIANINLYIKDITGAQMSDAEATRLKLAVPDPGEGIFGGDDPIKFASKLASTREALTKAAARYEHYLSKGITDPNQMEKKSPLDGMEIFVNPETGQEIVNIDGEWVPLP